MESCLAPSSVSIRLYGSLSAGLRRLANRPLAANDVLWTSGSVRHPMNLNLMACGVNRERRPAKKCDRHRDFCQEPVRPLFFWLALRATGRLDLMTGEELALDVVATNT